MSDNRALQRYATPKRTFLLQFGQCAAAPAAVLGVALLGLPAAGVGEVIGVRTPPSALEIAKLPQYCLGQAYSDKPEYRAPQFSIGGQFPNCGPGMNHFCPGIIALNRALRPGADRDHKSYWLGVARAEFGYTSRAMQPFPSCGLRPHLDAYLKLLEGMPKR